MTIGRRFLLPVPRLSRRPWEDAASELEDFLRRIFGGDLGVPGGFKNSTPETLTVSGSDSGTETAGWSPADHSHSILTDAPTNLGNALAEGSAETLSRSDHVHKRDVRVQEAAVDVGTRNKLNLVDSATIELSVVDDSGNDRVDVQADLTTVWRQILMPSQGINSLSSAAPPSISTATGMPEFSATLDNTLAGSTEMPPDYLAESTVKPHFHVVVLASNPGTNSRWKFEYNRANDGGSYENAYGSYSALTVVTVANPADTTLDLRISFEDLDMTGFNPETQILWRLSRLAGSDAADNDSTTLWALVSIDIDYQSSVRGTPI